MESLEHRVTLLEYKIIRINLVIAFIGKCDPHTQREASRLLAEIDRKADVQHASA